MKFATKVFITTIIFFIYIVPSHAQTAHTKAMWVWDFYKSAYTEEQRQQLIQFSLKNNINLLFVGTYRTLNDHPSDYANLIQMAHQNGIRIYALAGKSSWAVEDNHHFALKHIEQVLEYNSAHPSGQFDGIHHDIEPYTLSGFFDNIDRISIQFLQLMQDSMDLIRENDDDLQFDAAIPFWYATGKQAIIVEYNRMKKPLSHHILDIVDSVSIMAYRDNADAQIAVSKADIEYAARINKIAYVGVETMPPHGDRIPDWITYSNKNTKYMNEQMKMIEQHYRNHPGFGGIVIHAYDSFKSMIQKEEEIYQLLEKKFQALKSAGILEGYSDGSAGYYKTTTRAQAAVIAAKIGGYSDATLYKPVSASFLDVKPKEWFYGWVESSHRMGFMSGKANKLFDPHSNITVEELLIVMAKALGLAKVDGAAVIGASTWAQDWIQVMINEGLIEKRDDYRNEASREDLINLVYATLHHGQLNHLH